MDLLYRVVSSVVLVPVIALFVYLGGWPFFALAVAIVFIATREFCLALRHAGYRPLYFLTVSLALLFVADAQLTLVGITLPGGAMLARFALSLAVVGSLVWLVLRERDARAALTSWAFLFAGALYVGWLLRYYLLLRGLDAGLPGLAVGLPEAFLVVERGALWLGLVMVATWTCDTTAYFVGSAYGRRRLLPRISPSKTWEGTIAGVMATVLWTSAAGPLLGLPILSAVGLGLVVGVAAVLGDLAESLIKRGTRVKDASTLIPGHGGLLDRLDSMLFTGVAAYYFLVLTQAVHI